MCDALTEHDAEKHGDAMTRRDLAKWSAAFALAGVLPLSACRHTNETTTTPGEAKVLRESEVSVKTPHGVSDSYFVAPQAGHYPGVLMWTDIKGLRPAFKLMAKRLAMQGYAVLVPNPFYRDATHPVVGENASFADPDTRALLLGMAKKLTQDAAFSDAKAYVKYLDAHSSIDTSRKIGTLGYCMGGPLIMRTAGALPERIGAAASFHGGGLVTEKPDSPHLLIPQSSAKVLHAVAANDHERSPDTVPALKAAYAEAGRSAEIEVYEGTLHGWCPPDSQVYNEAAAEKAWARLLALFESALV